jgi:hypothetical protein
MKKVLFMVLAGVLAGMTFVPAIADDDEKRFEFDGMVRARYEYLNNYLDLTDNQGSGDLNDDSYSNAPYRVMIGMTGYFAKNVTGHVDLQYIGNFGDQLNPSWDNPLYETFPPPVGSGDAAYQYATQGVQLYTGWLEVAKIGGSDFGVRLGRQEDTYGTELFMGDNDYYSGLSFDGVRGMWQHGHNDLNLFYYKAAEANFIFAIPGGGGGANDSDVFGATYDFKFDTMGTVGGYLLFGQDMIGFGPIGNSDSSIMTYGARWNRPMMEGDKLNMFDWNIEAAGQNGDAGDPSFPNPSVDLAGWIFEGWFAFNFKAGDTHGRVHIGTLMTSGDKASTVDKSEDFITYYGDFHAYNRFGDLDWVDLFGQHNITDYNIGYEHWFGEQHYVMFAYHMFSATEQDPLATSDKLGDEIDLTYGYQYSKNLAFQFTAGQANPGEGAEFFYGVPNGDGDPVQRITAQAKLSW